MPIPDSNQPTAAAPVLDLKPLTALRFVAAMWVVVFSYWPDLLGGPAPPRLLANGGYGVELFFVLSGFILCHVYLERFGKGRFVYAGFLWARLSRIYPLHLATLLAVGAMALAAAALGVRLAHPVLYWPAFAPNLTLTHAWGLLRDAGWNHPAWSISAEWFAYLAFPLFALAAWRLRNRPRLALAGAAALLAVAYPLFQRTAGFPLTEATIQWGAVRIVPPFALGCAAWLLWRKHPIGSAAAAEAVSVIAVALVVALAASDAPAPVLVAVFGALIFALASLTGAGSALFSHWALVYLGEVSFAVYMVAAPWKMLALSGAQKLLHIGAGGLPAALWVPYTAMVLPVAMAAHHLVERPSRAVMRKWTPRLPVAQSGGPRVETSRNVT